MTIPIPLLLVTADPSHPLAHIALRYARAFLQNSANNNDTNSSDKLNIFFYGDGAHTANRLRWQSADQTNLTKEWQALAEKYQLALPVCVSTALSRGISDTENSARHQLSGDNLATGFTLVGLSDLAMMMQSNCRLIQF
ncbi:sulfurtransferase complex subunit TusD [Psychrobacter sp.]|uniref:sulfurtransferase complex subunit TusD n=1 Tax=Psychrobacter sp. TaxID=56811 RepID=UPI002647E2D1|nr:sulfurtransferase complex subunit TusD [Psychrobacter sp.]MDN6276861.1 sulfurtransferase complex subunit TusD [Psychrobacter sp.]MDN6308506.1 sulfurtransferase complex subunit TusD [Psychrobacter sp.]